MAKKIILFGASSEICQSYLKTLDTHIPQTEVICISSQIKNHTSDCSSIIPIYYETDYSPNSLKSIISKAEIKPEELKQVVIFNGQLSYQSKLPEKKIEDIDIEYFHQIFNTNALTPMLCLQSIVPYLNHKSDCSIVAFSARVGSIGDNNLGGWYSYRASKSALNMLYKSAAIEIKRRAKNTRLFLFHPGTTDTNLSKPFQKNVPKDKLFPTEFVAQQLFNISYLNNTDYQENLAYVDWQGKIIPW